MVPIAAGKTVSIAMTTYNGALYLEEQLLSILRQTTPPTKIVICDDCSTDGTLEIIQRMQQQYPVIKYVVNEQRLGVVKNFKKAVSLTGEADFVALSDQDDLWLPDKVEKMTKELALIDDSKHPAIVFSDLMLVNENAQVRNTSFWNELGQDGFKHCFETLLLGNFVTGCTVLMNGIMREHFAKMPDNVVMHDAWVSLVAFGVGKATELREPLVMYRSHATNVVFSSNAYRKKNKTMRMVGHLSKIFSKNDFLKREIRLLEMFNEQYGHLLVPQKAAAIKTIIQLKQRSYLRKLLVFRRILNVFRLPAQ